MLRLTGIAGVLALTLCTLTGCGGPMVASDGGASPVSGGSTSGGSSSGGDSHGSGGHEGGGHQGEGGHSSHGEGGNHSGGGHEGEHQEHGSGSHEESTHQEGAHQENSHAESNGGHSEGEHDAAHEESQHSEAEHAEETHSEGEHSEGEHSEGEHSEGEHSEGRPRPAREGSVAHEGSHEEEAHREGGHREGGHSEGGSSRPGRKPQESDVPSHLKGLKRKVYTSFMNGQDREAFMYHHADMLLAEGDEAKGLTEHWITALKQPKTGVRWGVGVVYLPERAFRDAPPQIGAEVKMPTKQELERRRNENRKNNRNRPNNNNQDNLKPRPKPPEDLGRQLSYYTGEVGEKALERLENRRTLRPYWGELLKEAPQGSGGNRFATSGRREQEMYEGEAYPEGEGAHGEGGRRPRQGGNEKSAAYLGAVQMAPGVLMLGTATEAELRENAEKMHLDLLMIFEVKVGRNRIGVPLNTTEINVIDLANRKTAARQTLNNIRVFTERQELKDGDVDPVEEAFDRLFRVIDPEYKASPMPDLAPEHVLVRAKQVVTGKYNNPLEPLAEMKYYHGRKLVDDSIFNRSCELLMGEEDGAAFVAAQDYDARYAVIKKYLPGGDKDGLPREEEQQSDVPSGSDEQPGEHSEDTFR